MSITKYKNTLFQRAKSKIKEENFKLIKTLISRGADVNSEYLFPAIQKKNMALVKLLISKGADVNVVFKNGSTPLNLALFLKNKPIVYLLLENGADVNANGKNGQTPLHFISTSSGSILLQAELIEKLIFKGANVNARTDQVVMAIQNGYGIDIPGFGRRSIFLDN